MGADSNKPSSFGALLRQRRQAANLTQEQLATRAGISPRTVSDLERGVKQFPRRDTAQLLLAVLGLTGEDHAAFLAAARRPVIGRHRSKRGSIGGHSRLPTPATPLIGRGTEIAAVAALLRSDGVRLLTLTGPGGVGKTRLALRAAVEIGEEFRDGVAFVDLSSLEDYRRVLPTMAHALGVREAAGRSLWEDLVTSLAGKRVLLVLDTFERVVAAAVDVAELLAACAGLKILATSREPLRVRPERRFPVPALPFPDPGQLLSIAELAEVPSIALFIDRAQAIDPAFALMPDNAEEVAAICRRLDGLPLAIELAAARLDTTPVDELRQQLDLSLGVLSDGPCDLPARQQTLWTTLRWSYETLTPDEQSLLRQLAVFAGGGTLEAVAAVAGADCEHLAAIDTTFASLAAKHLVQVETAPDGTTRYRLLDMVREFARDLAAASGDAEPAHQRHAMFYRDLAEESEQVLAGRGQRQMLDRLEIEHDNLRAALLWSLETRDAESAMRLASALWTFWEMRGYFSEGRSWLERALEFKSDVPPRLQARTLTAAAGLADAQGDFARAIALDERAIPLWRASGDRIGLARALNNLAIVLDNTGEYDRAAALYKEALAYHREDGDQRRIAIVLNNLGALAYTRGDYQGASAFHEEALALRRDLDDEQGVAASLNNLANAASALGDEGRAESLLQEALARYRALGDPAGTAAALLNLGVIARRRRDLQTATGRYEEALALQRRLQDRHMTAILLHHLAAVACQQKNHIRAFASCRESLALRQALGDRVGMGYCLLLMADIAQAYGYAERAAALIGTAEAIYEAVGHEMHPFERAELAGDVDALRQQLGEAAFLAACARGRASSVEAAIAEALAIAHEIGQPKLAQT